MFLLFEGFKGNRCEPEFPLYKESPFKLRIQSLYSVFYCPYKTYMDKVGHIYEYKVFFVFKNKFRKQKE